LIPKPFDPRLIVTIAPAVARAAMESGVAKRPIKDWQAYQAQLEQFVYHSGNFMKPIFAAAKRLKKLQRIVYCEGEDERILRAVQIVVDEQLARPILVGRPSVIEKRLERAGLRIRPGQDFEIVNPELDDRYRSYWQAYLQLTERKGVSEQYAKIEMRRRHTLIGCMMVHKGDADGMLCGTFGTTDQHLQYIEQVIGRRPGASVFAAMSTLILPERTLTLVDTHVNDDPTAEQIAEITILAAEEMRRFGTQPKAALLSHSHFGTSNSPSARKMRAARDFVRLRAPWLEVDGEMHGDAALDPQLRRSMASATLSGEANLLVMPNLDSANIAFNLLKTAAGNNVTIGPVLLGAARPVHVLTPSATVRRLINMTAWAVVDCSEARSLGD
jgi:malate dehydrogenase (oxaloacetate-decarboxylating)(NADP+)